MIIELSLDELRFIRACLDNAPAGRMPLFPAAFGLGAKLDNIIVAAQCVEGRKYIKEET
jgi:hypothetical protein